MSEPARTGPETLKDASLPISLAGCDLQDSFGAPAECSVKDILDIKDLHIGQKLEGLYAMWFPDLCDIGIHEDEAIHISHMSKQFIKHQAKSSLQM